MANNVEHPAHYNQGRIEVIAAIEDWKLGFHAGNVVKYVARAPHKGRTLEDLRKAQWYLSRLIELESAQCSQPASSSTQSPPVESGSPPSKPATPDSFTASS